MSWAGSDMNEHEQAVPSSSSSWTSTEGHYMLSTGLQAGEPVMSGPWFLPRGALPCGETEDKGRDIFQWVQAELWMLGMSVPNHSQNAKKTSWRRWHLHCSQRIRSHSRQRNCAVTQSEAEQHKVSENKASELNALALSKPQVGTSS